MVGAECDRARLEWLTSIAFVYCLKVSMISGARYQRVATYSVMNPVSPPLGSAVWVERARPKSQTLRSQFALRSRLDGFRSRWITSAECSALIARSVWYLQPAREERQRGVRFYERSGREVGGVREVLNVVV